MRKLLLWVLCTLVVTMLRGETATPLRTTPDGYFTDFLVGGPYPSVQVDGVGQALKTDFLTDFGGESHFQLVPGLFQRVVFPADKAKLIAGIGSTNEWGYTENLNMDIQWRELHLAEKDYPIEFVSQKPMPIFNMDGKFLPIDDYFAYYVACYVIAPEKREVTLRVGSDDDFKLFLNGDKIGETFSSQGIVPDNFLCDGTLQRGVNLILLKVVDRTQGTGFCLAISDREGNRLGNYEVALTDPRSVLQERFQLEQLPESYDRGFAGDFRFDGRAVFAGANHLQLEVVGPEGQYPAKLTLKKNQDPILEKNLTVSIAGTQPFRSTENLDLALGAYQVELSFDVNGETVLLQRDFEVSDLESIGRKQQELLQRKAKLQEKMRKLEADLSAATQQNQALHQEHETQYALLEEAYQARYAAIGERAGEAARSIREPLESIPDAERNLICLSGDLWQIAAAGEAFNRNATSPQELDKWQWTTFPRRSYNEYFRTWYNPVTPVTPDDPYGKVKGISGWEDFKFDDTICYPNFWARTQIDLPEDQVANRNFHFLCDSVSGTLRVFLNGTFCGEYQGVIGKVDIPLKGAVAGGNTLECYFSAPPKSIYPNYAPNQFRETYGIIGAIYLESSVRGVRQDSVGIQTSYRNAEISVQNELSNPTTAPVSVTVRNACVLNGEVRFRLPEVSGVIPPGGALNLQSSALWSDPELWGIGGKYGNPVLYDLVTDLVVDGVVVDRSVESFGFREFWISGCDFYFNGKNVVLQGDVGLNRLDLPKRVEMLSNLLRKDQINTIRSHDGDFHSIEFLRTCDRIGMFVYANMYPVLHESDPDEGKNFTPIETFLQSEVHQRNLQNYDAWFKMVRNHPSVVILSTDNEIYTQAWDTPGQRAFNERNDTLGALYCNYVKSLDPTRVMTRDGDVGTWGDANKIIDDPLCDTANYHYPDFNINEYVINWQKVFGFRPAVYGETLYHAYGAWDNWCGALPEKVAKKAAKVRQVAKIYRDWHIPCIIFMGLSSDGFILGDETGNGNPWGITWDEAQASHSDRDLQYPWSRIEWPSMSGLGRKQMFTNRRAHINGQECVNWFEAGRVTHVRNAVNDAYRDTLLEQPPLAPTYQGECLIDLPENEAGSVVSARKTSGAYNVVSVKSDAAGRAWFVLPEPGKYEFSVNGRSQVLEVPSRESYAFEPGFEQIAAFEL